MPNKFKASRFSGAISSAGVRPPIDRRVLEHRVIRRIVLILFLFSMTASGCSKIVESDLFVPLHLENVPKEMIPLGEVPKGIEVRVRGSKSTLESLKKDSLRCAIDLTSVRLGMQSIPIDPARIQLPGGVAVVDFSPKALSLELAREVEKVLPITVMLSGKPSGEKEVKKVMAAPLIIKVRGPETTMSKTGSIPTKPVDVSQATDSFQKEIALDMPEGFTLDDPSLVMSVRIEIGETLITRDLKGLNITGRGCPYRFKITPSTIDIEVKGPVSKLDAMVQKGSIDVFMDLKGLKPGVHPRRATLMLPPEISLVTTQPEIFTVTIFTKGEAVKR